MGVVQRAMQRAGHTRWFGTVMPRLAPPIDRVVHRVSGGRVTVAQVFLPTLMLTTTGRRSGLARAVPLGYVRHGEAHAVVASNFGQARHPAWSENLLAEPTASVTLAQRCWPVHARLAEGAERAALWEKFAAFWPAYDTYDARTVRDIRLFVLEPTGPATQVSQPSA